VKSSSTRPVLLVFAFAAATLGGDCDQDIARDPTFRDWCGDTLCAWTRDSGNIRAVPTWNENDLGVAFDDATQISQATTESSARCLLFTTVADIDPSAEMMLSIDFNSDGSIEYTGPLGAVSWQKVQTEVVAPEAYQGITFAIRKDGTGTAILAEIRIQASSGCTAPALTIAAGTLALGERCTSASDCKKGLTCATDTGEPLCAQCSTEAPCAGGAACLQRSVFLPLQCAPGQGLGVAGDPCLAGSDCASGECRGATAVPLAPEAGTCDLEGSIGVSDPANCNEYGARGGACR
jgi:hypothetical protein